MEEKKENVSIDSTTKEDNVTTEDTKKEVKDTDSKEVNKNNSNKFILLAVGIILLVVVIIFCITNFLSGSSSNKNISSVKRVLKTKYSYIDCIDYDCTGFVAMKGDKLKKVTVELLNSEGKKVASYTEKYDSDDKNVRTPYQLTDEYFIMRSMNSDDLKDIKYSIMTKKGKEVYTTSNKLTVINEEFIAMEDEKTDKYSILDTKGKEKYNNISDIDTYVDGKFISFKIDSDYTILNEKGDKILDGYRIAKVVEDDSDEVLYFVVEDIKKDTYYYYDIDKSEVVGDGFSSYKTGEKTGELIISKKVNNETVKYTLNKNGKQTKIEDEVDTSEIVAEIKESLDTDKYYLYSASVTKKGQKNILVDNKTEKSLGILNLDTNKFTAIYTYNSEKSYFYSTVDKLNEDDSDLYLRISCSKNYCGTPRTVIYDFEHTKEIYKVEDESLIVSDYIGYEDGYKVVKYSYSSDNDDYKGKYVLFDKNNKELLKSSNRIAVIDKEVEFGSEYTYSLTLYSAKEKKALNTEDEDATIITVGKQKLYKYIDEDDNTVICNLDGEKVVSSKSEYLKYTNTNIIYLEDDKIFIYDAAKDKTRKYKLKENEKINDASGDIIPSYKGAVFVNNSTDKYVKVVNSKGKVIKKINKVEIYSVKQSDDNDNVFIIVKGNGKTGNLYGLYIAK